METREVSTIPVWERARLGFALSEKNRKAKLQKVHDSKSRDSLETRQKQVDLKTETKKTGKQKLVWDAETKTWGFA